MTAAVTLCAALAAVSAALALPGRTFPPSPASGSPPGAGTLPAGDGRDPAARGRLLVSVLAAAAPVLLVGGTFGAVGGLVTGVAVHRVLARREPAADRRRREQVARGLPLAVDLLAVAMAAGAAPSSALRAVAGAVDGPVAEELDAVARGLTVGRDPARVWRDASRRPGLGGLGRAMLRAVESGAAVSDALARLAEDLRATARTEAESRARTVGVRAALPLGLCLLPAFVLVGVVPLVAGMVDALLG